LVDYPGDQIIPPSCIIVVDDRRDLNGVLAAGNCVAWLHEFIDSCALRVNVGKCKNERNYKQVDKQRMSIFQLEIYRSKFCRKGRFRKKTIVVHFFRFWFTASGLELPTRTTQFEIPLSFQLWLHRALGGHLRGSLELQTISSERSQRFYSCLAGLP